MIDEQRQLNLIASCNPDFLILHIKENTNYDAELLARVFELAKDRAKQILHNDAVPVAWAVVNVNGHAKYVTNDESEAAKWRDIWTDIRPLVYSTDSDRRDAERYRWLREGNAGCYNTIMIYAGDALDKAIDAALSQQKKES